MRREGRAAVAHPATAPNQGRNRPRAYRRRPRTHSPTTLVAPDCPCYLALRATTPLERTVVALRDLLGPLEGEVAGDLRLGLGLGLELGLGLGLGLAKSPET